MITHDKDVAEKADRKIFILDGELVSDEKGEEIHA